MPAAPDYVSQVRGVVNDLRQNYLQKLQLYQQNEQAKANLALQYAQLNAQRENSNMNRALQEKQLDLNYLQEANKAQQLEDKYNSDFQKQQYDVFKDSVSQDLKEREFKLKLLEASRTAQKEAIDTQAKQQAGVRLANFATMAQNKDYDGMARWYNEALKDTSDTLDYGAMINQASQIASGIQKTNDLLTVETLRPQLDDFGQTAANLRSNLQKYPLSERTAKLEEIRLQGNNLINLVRDETTRNMIIGTLEGLSTRERELEKEKSLEEIENFKSLGIDNRLPADIQAKFDNLYAKYPKNEDQNEEAFLTERRRLMLETNKRNSTEELKKIAKELADIEYAQILNPSYAVEKEDGTVSPKYPAPDLTPDYQIGNLDRDNNVSENLRKNVEKYVTQLRTLGVAKQESKDDMIAVNLFRALQNKEPISKGQIGAPETAGAPKKKVNFSNVSLLEMPEPKSGVPVSKPTAPSPDQAPAPAQAPAVNTTDYRRNYDLLKEIDSQIKAGNKTYVYNGKPTNINLLTLRNRTASRMGQVISQTFAPQFNTPPQFIGGPGMEPPQYIGVGSENMTEEFLTPGSQTE